jgi:hydroxymethylpyrimidine pyrophosphatase-like HAD family hydrolase
MNCRAFATDFDGTIATDGVVDEATVAALKKIRAAGAITLLVTGRQYEDFVNADAVLDLFDSVVAENGAVLYKPQTREVRLLASPPPRQFAAELIRRGVPATTGHVIVATVEPHEVTVLEVIKEMAIELQVIFNKGAVMILPSGVNKASGLQVALEEYGIELQDVVAAGDAENDHVFLANCGLSVAVANALPALKEQVKYVTRSNAGAGVTELIEALLRGDFERKETQTTA